MKVLIIDDEKTVLDTVYRQLTRMEIGIRQIETAGSAREAREKMQDTEFDIFLCDIVMPKEDGITFAKWVLNHKPHAKVIFLTAYADVCYMKEAISMHSFEYVLQPVEFQELQAVIERAVAQIKIEHKNREMIQKGVFFQPYEDNILEEGALQYLVGKSEECSYLQQLVRGRNANGPGKTKYLPVLLQVLKTEKELIKIEKPILRLIYQNILEEVFADLGVSGIVLLEKNHHDSVVVLFWKKELPNTRIEISGKLEEFRVLAYRVLQTSLAVYCGDVCEPKELLSSTKPLMKAMQDNVRQECRVFLPSDQEKEEWRAYKTQLGTWKKLLDQGNFTVFSQSVLHYLEKGPRSHVNAMDMQRFHESITQLVLAYLVNHQIGSEQVFDQGLPYLTYMNSWQNVVKFEKALEYIAGKLQLQNGTIEREPVQECIKLINQKLDQDISVSEIAEYVGLTPEYLTKLFRKKTGYTMKEYIAQEKMKSAKILLETTNLPVTLISSHVGYGNYSNFIRSFKQIIGCTPNEYRKKTENVSWENRF